MKYLIAILALLSASLAQVATGTPPWVSFGGGPFDAVNLSNNNVHFEIPILAKPGRGMNFSYSLVFDNTVWYPVTSGTTQVWTPVNNFGWSTRTQAQLGNFRRTSSLFTCYTGGQNGQYLNTTLYGYQDYADRRGASHGINQAVYTNPCTGQSYGGGSYSANDGSGLTFTLGYGTASSSAKSIAGLIVQPSDSSTQNAGPATDANGNRIDANYNSSTGATTFTDTLGSTALTITGAGTQASPVLFKYSDTSGALQTITVNYTTLTITTNFNCGTGYVEYGANGSITADLISSISLPNGTSYTFTYESTPGYTNRTSGRLASVTLPTGGTITYAYSGGGTGINGIRCSDGSTPHLNRTTSDSANPWQYDRVKNTGNWWTTTVTNPLNEQTILDYTQLKDASGVLTKDFVERQVRHTDGTAQHNVLGAKSLICYSPYTDFTGCDILNPPSDVSRPIVSTGRWDFLDTTWRNAVNTVFNSYLQPTDVYQYDWTSDGATWTLLRHTSATYSSLTNGMSVPSTSIIYDGAGVQQAKTTYGYDETAVTATTGVVQHVAVSGARGNLTSATRWSNGIYSPDPKSTYGYFDTGNIQTATDPGGHATTFSYSDNYNDGNHNTQAFPTVITAPSTGSTSHVTQNMYYWPAGLKYIAADEIANNNTFFYFDSMFRPTRIEYPDGGQTLIDYNETANIGWSHVQQKLDAVPNYSEQYTRRDGYGRPYSTFTKLTTTTANWLHSEVCFDQLGRTSFVPMPYLGPRDNLYSCAGQTNGDTYTYDSLGRQTQVTHADGSYATVDFKGPALLSKDEGIGNGNRTTRLQWINALGQMTAVCEGTSVTLPGGTGTPADDCGFSTYALKGFRTDYQYTGLGQLKKVSQAGLADRTYQYDVLGRLTSVTTPESGTTSFTYNADNLTLTRLRPAPNNTAGNVTTTYVYDALHRLTSRSYSDTTPAATFAYDSTTGWSTPYSQGRLAQMWTAGTSNMTSTVFSYDKMGRTTQENQIPPSAVNATSYPVTYTYDPAGRLATYTNGKGKTFTASVDAAGRLTQLSSDWVDSTHPGTLLSNIAYNEFGPTAYTMGSTIGGGVQTSLGYNSLGQLQTKQATTNGGSGTVRFNMYGMGYAPNGNLTTVTDNSNTWSNGYDDLGRLLTSNKGATAMSFTYDRFGNRETQTAPIASSTPTSSNLTPPGPAGTNRIDANNVYHIAYDAVGNIINERVGTESSDRTYTYDAENRIVSVTGPGLSASYVYDAFSRRASKTANGTTTEYLYQGTNVVSEIQPTSGTLNRTEIYFGGMHIGTYVAGKTYFSHTNYVGTERIKTDETGALAQDCDYQPFGDGESCAIGPINSPIRYAGYERDSETGLDHMPFRYYNSRIGRFMSGDLLSGSADQPQSLNKFGYTSNNPANLTDPSGLDPCNSPESCQAQYQQIVHLWAGQGYPTGTPGTGTSGGCSLDGVPASCTMAFAAGGLGPASSITLTEYLWTPTALILGMFCTDKARENCEPGIAPLYGNINNPFQLPNEVVGSRVALQQTNSPQQVQSTEQNIQQCVSEWRNSLPGKVVGFGSLVSFADDLWGTAKSWAETIATKGAFFWIMELGGQSAAAEGEITTVKTVFKPAAGKAGTVAVVGATAIDLETRAGCAIAIDKKAMTAYTLNP